MKIISFKKKKGNQYEITFNNRDKINLYDDVILKYDLLITKEVDSERLKVIMEYNSYLKSYYEALKYINVKLRTETEIRKKLKDYSHEAIDYTINRLRNDGYLNEELYIKSYINDVINLKMEGPNKILYELKKLGFPENLINNYLDTFPNEIWLAKIDKIITKKINSNHNLSSLVLKQKIIQDLHQRGFANKDINLVIANHDFQDNHLIYEKEYEKLKNKLAKKYSGSELEYQIKSKLYQKGFRN